MEHEEGAFQIRSILQCFHHYYTSTGVSLPHGLWSPQDPQPVPTESVTGILRINQTIQLTEGFPLKGTPFQQKPNFLMYLFPSLANAGELQLCVALSDRLDLFLSKKWTALRCLALAGYI